ncbi:MAG: type III secretion system export apparatus subunit SctR [Granulosicoccaceae bacterium]
MDLTSFSPSSALITVVLLSLAPFVAVMITSFTKIVVVLSLLRSALGVQQVPPNIVLNGLALILTIYVMYPVGQKMSERVNGIEDISSSTDALFAAANTAKEPLREFLVKHSSKRERGFFLKTIQKMADEDQRDSIKADDFIVIVPAFTISELTMAFQIGFLIFLPFIIVDLVVSNILLAMGMMMLSPTIVSLPFKLLLFVLVEGWAKLAHGLVLSYL